MEIIFYIGSILGETLLKKCSPPNPLPKISNIELGRGALAPLPSSLSKSFWGEFEPPVVVSYVKIFMRN
jgi:hypothetical protein